MGTCKIEIRLLEKSEKRYGKSEHVMQNPT